MLLLMLDNCACLQEHPRGKLDPRPPLVWRFKGAGSVCEWELPELTPEGDSLTICAYDYSDLGHHLKLASFSIGGRCVHTMYLTFESVGCLVAHAWLHLSTVEPIVTN